jgi:hypothetical protein
MDVLTLLDKLDDVIYEARPVPLTDQVRIDRGAVYSLLDQIRLSLPDEIKRARWMMDERPDGYGAGADEGGRLGEIMDSIEELKRSQERVAPPPLTAAASEKVRSIVEAAEASAAEVRSEAEREARRIEAEAQRLGREIRERSAADADAHLKRAEDMMKTLLEEAGTASASVDALLERVRGPAASLTAALSDSAQRILCDFDRLRGQMAEGPEGLDRRPPASTGVVAVSRRADASPGAATPQETEQWSWGDALEAEGQLPQADAEEEAWDGADLEGDGDETAVEHDDDIEEFLSSPDAHFTAGRLGGDEDGYDELDDLEEIEDAEETNEDDVADEPVVRPRHTASRFSR